MDKFDEDFADEYPRWLDFIPPRKGGDGMPTQEELQEQAAELIRESNELA